MARIRTIKPEFFTSLTVADLTPEQRLTFIGLWTHVDDAGRCVDDPRLIKAAVWPLDDRTAADVEVDLKALSESSLITRYMLNRKRFLAVTGWEEHQRINRPSPSKIPPPDQGEPTPPSPSSRPDSASLRAHAHFSEGSNATREAGGDDSRNGPYGEVVGGSTHNDGVEPPTAGQEAGDDALTSTEADFTEPSAQPHAHLTEDSPPERNREQGKEQGTGRGERACASEQENLPAERNSTPQRPDGRPAPIDDAGFALTDSMRRWAVNTFGAALDVDYETAQFIDHHRAQGKKRPNWSAEWQKWMRRSAKWASERANVVALPAGRRSTTDDRVSAAMEIAAEFRALEGGTA